MSRPDNGNIRQYKKPLKFNVGIFIFGMVFLYFLAFGIFQFLRKDNISSYVVNAGSLSDNTVYTALALREEQVFTAGGSGDLQLYAKEGSKVSYGDTIYSLDASGALKATLANIGSDQSVLTDKDLAGIRDTISTFKKAYDGADFTRVRDFKMTLESDIIDSLNLLAINSGKIDTSKLNIVSATIPGIILYSYDGYEGVTVDSFTGEMVNNHKLQKTITRGTNDIKSGDIVYKLITDEHWNLIMEIDDSFEQKLLDTKSKSLRIRFLDDSQFAWVNFEIINRDGIKYLVLSIPNSAIRYADQRFVKIEIQLSSAYGLKVPISSVVNKYFYTIPKEYITQGGPKGKDGFMVEKDSSVEFVEADIVMSDDKYYYVNQKIIESGSKVRKPNSTDTFTVEAVSPLDGVYNINKGYPVFETVTVLDKNSEYAIVSSNSRYGVERYDYIALNGDAVKEDDIIH